MTKEFDTEEALEILKELSRVEGYLLSVKYSGVVLDTIDYSVRLLSDKLSNCDKDETTI